MNLFYSSKSEDGFTLIEVLIAISILAIISSLSFYLVRQVNNNNATIAEQTEFHQSFQAVKDLVERQVRFANKISVSNNGTESGYDREIYASDVGKIIFNNCGKELVLSGGDNLRYDIKFEKLDESFVQIVLTAKGIYNHQYDLGMKLLILAGEIQGASGSYLYFNVIDDTP